MFNSEKELQDEAVDIKCLTFPEESFANLIKDKNVPPFFLGKTIPYECADGYTFSDPTILISKKYPVFTCKFKHNVAVWDYDRNACKPVSCGHPGFVENADVIGNSFVFPEKVKYQCHEGFKIQNIGETFCMATGIWSPSVKSFKCNPITCPYMDHPPNGAIYYSNGDNYGSKATYSCRKGYRLTGNNFRICTQHGTWDGIDPTCEKIACGKPTLNAPKDSYDVGETYHYKCPQTNEPIIMKCKGDGSWTVSNKCDSNDPITKKIPKNNPQNINSNVDKNFVPVLPQFIHNIFYYKWNVIVILCLTTFFSLLLCGIIKSKNRHNYKVKTFS